MTTAFPHDAFDTQRRKDLGYCGRVEYSILESVRTCHMDSHDSSNTSTAQKMMLR